MTSTGITITQKGNQILVDSVKYNEDSMYQDVTIDTYMKQHRVDTFRNMLKKLSA